MRALFLTLMIAVTTAVFPRPSICLNMIVKDEKDVICRCLSTVKDYIDTWVIVDTGSTDGTQDLIREYLKDIPGELYERPWKNFAHNRNEALQLALGKSDYLLFIDADETLEVTKDFLPEETSIDCYNIQNCQEVGSFLRQFLVKNDPTFRWEGVIHEGILCTRDYTASVLDGATLDSSHTDGNRSKDPNKYARDADVIEEALKEDPNNGRLMFYLGQSYAVSHQLEKALEAYHRATLHETNSDNVFYAYYQSAKIKQFLGYSEKEVAEAFMAAHSYDMRRVEPLFEMALNEYNKENYALANIFGIAAIHALDVYKHVRPYFSFIHDPIYDWRAELLMSQLYAKTSNLEEAKVFYDRLLAKEETPQEIRQELLMHLQHYEQQRMQAQLTQ